MTNGIPDSILDLDDNEQDMIRTEAWNAQHPSCDVCPEALCLWNRDGTCDCVSCELERGESVEGGAVHDDCKEKYIGEVLVAGIFDALKVRLPLGMDPWAHERSRNIATIIMAEFSVKPKETK